MFDCQRVFYRQSQCSTANKKRRLSTGGFEAVTPCHHWKAREMRNIPSQVKLAWERCQRHTWHSYPNDLIYWRPPTESTKWCGKILRSSVKFGTCLLQITCIFCLPRQPKFLTPWVWCTETDRRVSCRWLRGMGWLLKNFWAVLVVPKRHPFWRFWWSCLMLFAACKIPLASLAHVTAQSATESMAGDVSTALVALASPKWLKTTWGLRDLRAFMFPSLVLLGLFCQTITGLVNMSSLPARRAALVDTGCSSARKIMKSRAGGPWHPMAMEPLGQPLTDFLEMGRWWKMDHYIQCGHHDHHSHGTPGKL